jgi:hypothetical protein
MRAYKPAGEVGFSMKLHQHPRLKALRMSMIQPRDSIFSSLRASAR